MRRSILAHFFIACSLASAQSHPAFEVTSVKPGDPAKTGLSLGFPHDRFAGTVTVRMLIQFAYDILNVQMTGGPSWIASERFDIAAQIPALLESTSAKERTQQIRLMTQSLLADRFHMSAHFEKRRQPVYEMVIAKGGSRLVPGDPAKPGPIGIREGQLSGTSASLDTLTQMLTGVLDRQVIDKTGLKGPFDFLLKFAPVGKDGADADNPNLFTAIQEQLGLKLQPAQELMDVLVIDSVERPDSN